MPLIPDLSLTAATALLAIDRAQVFSTFACGSMGARIVLGWQVGWYDVFGAALDALLAHGLIEYPEDDEIAVTGAGRTLLFDRGWLAVVGSKTELTEQGAYWLRRGFNRLTGEKR